MHDRSFVHYIGIRFGKWARGIGMDGVFIWVDNRLIVHELDA
jgi:hypothetical protein